MVRVRYAETDTMGVVYYANYLTYFEVGRVEFLRQHGLPMSAVDRKVRMPVVEASVRYVKPARLDDLLRVRCWIGERKRASFVFRYEVRRWRDGAIPDLAEEVAGPVRLSDDPATAQRLLALVPQVPTPVWGRDELGAGEMWNSNSTISWLLTRSGVDAGAVPLPPGGRAPGWDAGVAVARRATVREWPRR